jgi:hypothetical protein
MSKSFHSVLTPSRSGTPPTLTDERPAVLRLVSDPLTAARLEKLRISLTRQISRHGWRFLALALQAACEHGAHHQRANPRAVALWQWRAQLLRQLAMQEQPPTEPAVTETTSPS